MSDKPLSLNKEVTIDVVLFFFCLRPSGALGILSSIVDSTYVQQEINLKSDLSFCSFAPDHDLLADYLGSYKLVLDLCTIVLVLV